jgi:hypothetical protein
MLWQIAIGSILLILTVFVHAIATRVTVGMFKRGSLGGWHLESGWGRVAAISTLVLLMFFVSLLEAWIWAVAFLAVGEMPSLEAALYFSTVTFTSLGAGDVSLSADWRLLGSFEAANGRIMFGWTTALIVGLVHTAFSAKPASNPPG